MNAGKKKSVIQIIVVSLIVLFAGNMGQRAEVISSSPGPPQSQPNSASKKEEPVPKSVVWKKLIPEIKTLLKQSTPYDGSHAMYSVRIFREADITGDGVPEALVYPGEGGASTDILLLMRVEDGRPVMAKFRDARGKETAVEFLEGASAMHGNHTEMLPAENAIYMGGYFMNADGTGFQECSAKAYRWNANSEIFDWDSALSKKVSKEFCEGKRKALVPH